MRKQAILLGMVLLGFISTLSYAQAPVPFINQPLIPDAMAPGGPQFTLTVNGTGFVSNSAVIWNGSALATQFVSGSQLTAIVPAANIATASTASVTVVNPAPGGGASNVAFFMVAPSTRYAAFNWTSSPPTGGSPNSMAVGDFNGDGKLDLAGANACGGRYDCQAGIAFVLLGDGTGNFTAASSTVVGQYPEGVAVGDFNGDGKLDLAVANSRDNSVSILLGDGAGHLSLFSTPAVGNGPCCLAVGDFNGDGKLDLAVVNEGENTVSILLGDGKGNFTVASSPAVGQTPVSVATGDFNGDGKLDLAVVNERDNSISILLGDGTGSFVPVSSPATGFFPVSASVGDFDGDGKLDLAVVNEGDGTVSILLGDGTGNFALKSSTVVCVDPDAVAVGDFNGDGKLDLVVDGYINRVSLLLGDGTGNLSSVSLPGPNLDSSWVVVGDFNGDGKLDLAFNDPDRLSLYVMLQAPTVPAVVLSPTSLTFGPQLVGTSSDPQLVTLTNIGGAPLKIKEVATHNVNFSQTNNCHSKVLPNKQCIVKVRFVPHSIGTHTGAVTIKDDASGSPQTVPLTGVGTVVTLLPSILDFGDQPVGTTSQPQTVTLTNHGKTELSIRGIQIKGSNSGSFAQSNNCGTSVPAGGTCTISVTFTPHYKGVRGATLDVGDNGGGSPQMAQLVGVGT